MTKRSFLTVVLVLALVFMLVGCGSDKKESEKTDTGDSEAVADTDQADTGDTEDVEIVPDGDIADAGNTEALPDEDPSDTDDTEVVPDEDNTDTGNVTQEGCTIKTSIGTHSTKRDLTESCVQKIAKAEFAICDWNYEDEEETVKHIEYLQKLVITFGQECKDNSDKIVECPDLIPESLKLGSLSGCDVYSIEPDTDCLAPCADLYFTTDNNILNSVYVGESGIRADPFIKSSDSVKEVAFSSDLKIGSNKAIFTWSEKAEDGTEIEKKVSVEMVVNEE